MSDFAPDIYAQNLCDSIWHRGMTVGCFDVHA